MWNLLKYVWNHPLNVDGRLAALLRVLRWQFVARLMPGLIALPYVQGTWLFATRGMTGATGNWYCGLHEVHEMAFVLHLLRPGEHFVDVGANVGSYTVLAGGGVNARVTAVEPIPATFAHLQRNVALNNMNDRVRCCMVGLLVVTLEASARACADPTGVQAMLHEAAATPADQGVLVTRFDPRRISHREALQTLRQQWGEQLIPYTLHEDENIPRALARAMCVHSFAPQAQSAHDLQGVCNWLTGQRRAPPSMLVAGARRP